MYQIKVYKSEMLQVKSCSRSGLCFECNHDAALESLSSMLVQNRLEGKGVFRTIRLQRFLFPFSLTLTNITYSETIMDRYWEPIQSEFYANSKSVINNIPFYLRTLRFLQFYPGQK